MRRSPHRRSLSATTRTREPMCEACVEAGLLRQETLEKLDAFAENWPGTAFGVAHAVIDDSNVDNASLDRTIERLYAFLELDEERWNRSSPGISMAHYLDDWEPMEIIATIQLCQELRALPEAER